jgi:hypothetical protein
VRRVFETVRVIDFYSDTYRQQSHTGMSQISGVFRDKRKVHLRVIGTREEYSVKNDWLFATRPRLNAGMRSRKYQRGTNLAQVGKKDDRALITVGASVVAAQRITSAVWKRMRGGIVRREPPLGG